MESEARRPEPRDALGPRLPLLIPLALFLAVASGTLVFWARSIPFPYGLEHGEGIVLDSALQVAEGSSPYHDMKGYPYTVGNYPPLYYWLNGLAVKLFGVSFAPGRALSVASALAAALLLFSLTSSLTGEPLAGALAALFYLSHPTVRSASALLRVDALAGALAFGGLVVALRTKGRAGLWTAAALFALGLATKHSAVVTPAVACVGLAAMDPRRGLRLAACTAGLTACWLAAGLALYGPVMLLNLGPYTAAPLEYSRLAAYLSHLPREYLPGLVALPAATFWAWRRRSPVGFTAALYGWAAVASLALLSKHGSSFLYLSEFSIAMALALGLAAGWGLQAAERLGPGRGAAAVAAGCVALLVLRSPPPLNPVAQPISEARSLWAYDLSQAKAEDERMVRLLRKVEGPVLAESADLALAAGKKVLVTPFTIKELARMGLWDEAPLLEDLKRRYFAAVQLDSLPSSQRPAEPLSGEEERRRLLTRGRFSLAVLEAIDASYEVAFELARGAVYLPRREDKGK